MPGVCLNSWMKFTQMIISMVHMFVLTELPYWYYREKSTKNCSALSFFNFNNWRYKLRYMKQTTFVIKLAQVHVVKFEACSKKLSWLQYYKA